MNKAASTVGTSQGGVFLRNATGLLREVSLLDAFIMNTFGMNIAVGAVFLFLQAPAFFPRGNMLVAVIIGTLLASFPVLGITTQWWVIIIGVLINIGFAVLLILGGQSFWLNRNQGVDLSLAYREIPQE